MDVGYWSADNDIGEMFYNFWLHESLRNLCGVDLSKLFVEEMTPTQRVIWERWYRCPMGIKPSPYQAVGAAMNFKRVLLGDPSDEKNVYQWDIVVENLPAAEAYDPSLPWVYKQRSDGSIAADVHIYVDDGRSTARNQETTWLASSKFSKVASFLGMQDALRKRWCPSQTPDDWFGVRASTTADGVFKSVSPERVTKPSSTTSAGSTKSNQSDLSSNTDTSEASPSQFSFHNYTYNVFTQGAEGSAARSLMVRNVYHGMTKSTNPDDHYIQHNHVRHVDNQGDLLRSDSTFVDV